MFERNDINFVKMKVLSTFSLLNTDWIECLSILCSVEIVQLGM